MLNTKVVQLGKVRAARDLLSEWEKVRQAILAGEIDGFMTALRCGECETIYLGGVYKENSHAAMTAAMKASISRMLAEDPPLPMRAAIN